MQGAGRANQSRLKRTCNTRTPKCSTLLLPPGRRSKKVEDVAGNPWAEVAWYFPDSREQFRMLGRLTLVDAASQDAALQ